MRAAVVTSFDKPWEITEVPTPEPGPGEVLVRIEASGLCHTDIHAARALSKTTLKTRTSPKYSRPSQVPCSW